MRRNAACSFTFPVIARFQKEGVCELSSVQPQVAGISSLSVPNLAPKIFIENIATIALLPGVENSVERTARNGAETQRIESST